METYCLNSKIIIAQTHKYFGVSSCSERLPNHHSTRTQRAWNFLQRRILPCRWSRANQTTTLVNPNRLCVGGHAGNVLPTCHFALLGLSEDMESSKYTSTAPLEWLHYDLSVFKKNIIMLRPYTRNTSASINNKLLADKSIHNYK